MPSFDRIKDTKLSDNPCLLDHFVQNYFIDFDFYRIVPNSKECLRFTSPKAKPKHPMA